MLRIDRVIKPWKDAAALNEHINLYGFWNDRAFLTKSGDLGMVLAVHGVDYESMDQTQQEYAVKLLEAALKSFGPGFHVYQYLFKQNRPDIPFAHYEDSIVEVAIDQRRDFFEAKRDLLFEVEIFYVVVLEGARSKPGVGTALGMLFSDPARALNELKSQFSQTSMKRLLRSQIETCLTHLEQRVETFAHQLADFVKIAVQDRQGQFTLFRRLLNFEPTRIAGRPHSTQFLDYQVANSDIEAERDHLRIGSDFVRILTMKESIIETRPLVLDALLKIPASFTVCTEWVPVSQEKARKEVTKRRRHFNISKTGFVSQLGNDTTKTNPRDVLIDESKQADIENLGECLRALGEGQSLGNFSLPTALGADVPIYNLSDISSELNFTADALAGIFLGKITRWNDPVLQNANPGIKLPNRDIIVVHRSDGSGTTYVWADYLAKVSPEWKTKVGVAAAIIWPVGIGGKGNDGVADTVKRTPNSIGYVELIYAIQTHMPYGKVMNSSGSFVKANLASVTAAAAAAVKNMPADFRVSITNPPARDAYPISSFTWLLIPKEVADKSKGAALKAFLIWGLTDGQNLNESLSYSRVPQSVLDKELVAAKQLKY